MHIYKDFELRLPFHRDDVLDFWETLLKAHKLSGDQGFIYLDHLLAVFDQPHWQQQLRDPDSITVRVLTNEYMTHTQTGAIDFDYLAVLACLLCSGTTARKVDILECIVHQGPVPEFVEPNSELFIQTFGMLCNFATLIVFRWAFEFEGISNGFQAIEMDLVKVITNEETGLPYEFNQQVFGSTQKLSVEDWKDSIADNASYLFDSALLRKQIMERAGVIYSE